MAHIPIVAGPRHSGWIAATLLALLASALYAPFLGNPMFFDDQVFFSGSNFANSAMSPFGLGRRHPPYFTLAFPQVMWGPLPPWEQPQMHRMISLFFHWACTFALFRLLHDLLAATGRSYAAGGTESVYPTPGLLAFCGAALFVLHPVAVYGAGYLMQRSMLMGTLFALISLIFFARGLTRARYGDALYAALFYWLAVLSREHAVMLPAVALLIAFLIAPARAFGIRYALAYLIACLPAAIWVTTLRTDVIGQAYEPYVDTLLDQITGMSGLDLAGGSLWLFSAATQAGLFFQYLYLWLVPDTSLMSIDLRIDFAATSSTGWLVAKFAALTAFAALGFLLVLRRGREGLVGLGMLYMCILYATEFVTVRFQEPFVLYRAYLWGPGVVIGVTAAASHLSRKVLAVAFVAVIPVLYVQAFDRLQSFSSNLALWEDAAAKLPANPVPYGSRVLFGLAREQVYAGRIEAAAATADRCVRQYPESWHCSFSRGAAYVQQGGYTQALEYFERALQVQPDSGLTYTHRGIALERLGRRDEARASYRRASELGFLGGDYRLSLLDGTGTGRGQMIYTIQRAPAK